MKKILSTFIILIFVVISISCNKENNIYYDTSSSIYNDSSMWCYNENNNKDVDTFFINPTASSGIGNMELNDENKTVFSNAVKMEKRIYDSKTNFISPFYHQALLDEYNKDKNDREEALSVAYSDIKSAFEYYLMNMNDGHEIILAGFSQGADMCLRLLSDYSNNDLFYNKYVACYAIGWIVTNDYLASSNRIKMAEGENDKKCIISFNSEDPSVTSSFIVGSDEYSNSINPLTWKRDNNVADKSLNLGAVFLNTDGAITSEISNLTGCYIDQKRGTLKVTDISYGTYTSEIDILSNGVYHLWDYQFFYNNLKENVIIRIK